MYRFTTHNYFVLDFVSSFNLGISFIGSTFVIGSFVGVVITSYLGGITTFGVDITSV